jgi:hypothetical protein
VDLAAAARARLAAQGLVELAADPVAAVRRLLAVQAQVHAAPLFAIAARTAPVAPRSAIEAAFAGGALVRTWAMRGTLHVVAAEDVGALLGVTGDRMLAALRGPRRRAGVSDEMLAAARSVAECALGAAGLLRPELLAAFAAAGLDPGANRGYHLILGLAAQGVLHLGAREGGQYRVLASAGRIPEGPDDQDAALPELAIRYLAGHGPASERDLAWWAGVPLTWARRAIAEAPGLERVEIDGAPAWRLAGSPDPAPSEAVHLLPAFDELVMGYADRAALLRGHPLSVLVPGRNGSFLPMVTVDGRLVGTWSASGQAPRVHPLEPLPSAVAEKAERQGEAWAAWSGVAQP